MKFIKIPLYLTFINWIIAVFIGSVLLPFTSSIIGSNSTFVNSEYFEVKTVELIAIAILASGLFSIPALIALFITHLLMNRKEMKLKNHQLVQNTVHVFASVLTFIVIGYCLGKGDNDLLAAISITYPLVGIIVWNITYVIYWKKSVE